MSGDFKRTKFRSKVVGTHELPSEKVIGLEKKKMRKLGSTSVTKDQVIGSNFICVKPNFNSKKNEKS